MIKKITVKGAVQGVGYRPFIFSKASEYGLKGQVKNLGSMVEIIVSGDENKVNSFAESLKTDHPKGAIILAVNESVIGEPMSFDDFSIVSSGITHNPLELPIFLPDIGICDDCMSEMLNPANRRYRYPLTSCASCGPRISILNSLPYDRDTTTMEDFRMCPECSREYKLGRRKHAQTISCHDCGPQILLSDSSGSYEKEEAVAHSIDLLKEGKILGLKGISGYQLICLPTDETAERLRQIKGRENKPFAVMFADIDCVKSFCEVNDEEERLLKSSARPIVLLKAKREFPYEVSKNSRYIGAFLPSSGIHRLLCDGAGPIICTSANKSGAPMIINDDKFKETFLTGEIMADGVIYHKRRINMPQDDSVMFVINEPDGSYSSMFIRRARGFSPLPIITDRVFSDNTILALGGDLKSTFSFAKKDRIIPSQYIGDLEQADTLKLYKSLLQRYKKLFEIDSFDVICDMHPGYHSTNFAFNNLKDFHIDQVQHHHAHVLSVMAENSIKSCIGVAFDGTGYGIDGKVWGSEILSCEGSGFIRRAHLSYITLCGGDKASRDAELVKKCYELASGNEIDDKLVKAALLNKINTFETSSMGRLFDVISSLLGICSYNSYEGECAIMLEKSAWESDRRDYPEFFLKIVEESEDSFTLDQANLYAQVKEALNSLKYKVSDIAYGFHRVLSLFIKESCIRERNITKKQNVCLSGGVFGNRLLLELCIKELKAENFQVYYNKKVPSGDGGISLGQAYYGMLKNSER